MRVFFFRKPLCRLDFQMVQKIVGIYNVKAYSDIISENVLPYFNRIRTPVMLQDPT